MARSLSVARRRDATFLGEELFVDFTQHVSLGTANTDVVLDHQVDELLSVDQDDSVRDLAHEIAGLGTERRGRDEHAFGRLMTLQAPRERLELRTTHGGRPPLRLQVDDVESEG